MKIWEKFGTNFSKLRKLSGKTKVWEKFGIDFEIVNNLIGDIPIMKESFTSTGDSPPNLWEMILIATHKSNSPKKH